MSAGDGTLILMFGTLTRDVADWAIFSVPICASVQSFIHIILDHEYLLYFFGLWASVAHTHFLGSCCVGSCVFDVPRHYYLCYCCCHPVPSWRSTFVTCISYPSSWISHFSQELQFLLLTNAPEMRIWVWGVCVIIGMSLFWGSLCWKGRGTLWAQFPIYRKYISIPMCRRQCFYEAQHTFRLKSSIQSHVNHDMSPLVHNLRQQQEKWLHPPGVWALVQQEW